MKQEVGLQINIVELEHEIESVKERIRDIEWRLDRDDPEVSKDSRQRALDKLRWLSREVTNLKKELLKCQQNQPS